MHQSGLHLAAHSALVAAKEIPSIMNVHLEYSKNVLCITPFDAGWQIFGLDEMQVAVNGEVVYSI